jgi:hypothetical protein
MPNVKLGFAIRYMAMFSIMLFSCSKSKMKVDGKHKQLQGSFRSTKGVMQVLSCYCFNGGYLVDKFGKLTPICFENSDVDISCDKITILGHYKTIKNKAEPTSVCKAGEMTYFNVVKFQCQ